MSNASTLPQVVGKAVRFRRRSLGFSQEELAFRAGLNRTYVTDVERGARNLSLNTVERLARALQLPLTSLLHSTDPAATPDGITAAAVGGDRIDIFFVEDNQSDIEWTLHAMAQANLANSIQVARDGAEALDYLFCTGNYAHRRIEDRPQLILLDLKLPKIDGLEVLRRLKADARTQTIPVVMLTGSEDRNHVAEARRLGADAYLMKPVDFQGLTKITPDLNFSWSLAPRAVHAVS